MVFAVPLHVMGADACVRHRGGRLVVMRSGTVEHTAALMRVSSLVLHGTVGISTPALHALLGAGIPVVLLARNGRAIGRVEPPGAEHGERRIRQLRRCADPELGLELSRSIVVGKITNQRTLLMRRLRGHAPSLASPVARLGLLAPRAVRASSLGELVGVEGAASRLYFNSLRQLVPAGAGFEQRDRLARDIVNTGINYCAALLRETVLSAVASAGLDPSLSHLHVPTRGRPTLVFDLMEEFRPVLVEGTVLPLVGLGALGDDDVEATADGPRLSDPGRRAIIGRFYDRLDTRPSTLEPSPRPSTYRAVVERQVARYVAWVDHGRPYEAFRWR